MLPRSRCAFVLLTAIALVGAAAPAARIRGRVFAADTGRPLAGAIVTLVDTRAADPMQRLGRWIRTDADGSWEVQDLAPGSYVLNVTKTGYAKIQYGQKHPFERGKILQIAAGQVLDKIDVTLPRGGAITGRVFDEFGDPVAPALVRVLRRVYVDGRRELKPLGEDLGVIINGTGDVTDDLGQFRLYGLAPGDYYVSAIFSPGGEAAAATGYPPVYYPGTASIAEARHVRVGAGEDTPDINLTLVSARYAIVSGTVLTSTNAPARASVMLYGAGAFADAAVPPAATAANGSFTLRRVPPGDYRLHVFGVQGAGGVPELASVPVSVAGEDVTDVTVTTAPGAIASGRVVVEEGAKSNARLFVRSVNIGADAPTFLNASVGVNPDLTFQVSGLAGRQTFRAGMLPEGWFLKSVTHEGVDITDSGYEFRPGQRVSGIELVVSRRATTLSGTVQDDRDRPVDDYTVVAFSTNPARWGYQTRFIQSARPDQDGRFRIRGLPPDEYYVVALEYVETGQELDPEQLGLWKAIGSAVDLKEGEAKTLTLQLQR